MRISHKSVLFSLALAVCLTAGSAYAQATRTWVSGVGDDANPCSRTAPCKTFPGAISKTATCGEIDVLDPGGFGTITITKSITIDGTGTFASVLNAGSVNGIVVAINATDSCGQTVILRSLSINGAGTGLTGVRNVSTVATNLHIENCLIQRQTTNGVSMISCPLGTKLYMSDVQVNAIGQDAILVDPAAGATNKVHLEHVIARQYGLSGFHAVNDVTGTIAYSYFQEGNEGIQINDSTSHLNIAESFMSENAAAGLDNGGTATTVIDGSSIFDNNPGVKNNTGGSVVGFGNNGIANNLTADVLGTAVVTASHP
jgi:hypothetical protein